MDPVQMRALLLAPENNPDCCETDDITDRFEAYSPDDIDSDHMVFNALCEHYGNTLGWKAAPNFGHERYSDGLVESYFVSVPVYDPPGIYLTRHHDIKYLGRHQQTGLNGAVHTALVLHADAENLLSEARRLGLLEASADPDELEDLSDQWRATR